MTLEYIKADSCPICQAATVAESCERCHTNGEGFERRKFACGMELSWSPNFSRLETSSQCPKDVNTVRKVAKQKAAKLALQEFLANLDVDQAWKDCVTGRIGYL